MEDLHIVRSEHPPATNRWSLMLPVVLGALVAILLRLPGLGLPLERDEGAYGLIASLWRKGLLPYRDLFDHKPPLIYLLYMPAVVGTPGPIPIRIWQTCLFILQLPLLQLIGLRVYGQSVASLTTLIYAVAGSAFYLQGLIFNTEQALTLPALAALWALIHGVEDKRMRWSLLYGLFLGVISLIKPTAVPLLLLLALAFRAQSPWMYIRNGLTTTLAMLVMWLPVFAYWGSAGALNDLRFALLDYNRMYATESTVRWSIGGLVDMLAPLALLLVCAAGGTLWGHAAPGRRRHMAVTLWTLAFLGAGLLGMRTYIHYYYPALAGLSLLAVLLILTLVRQAWHAHGLERLVGVGGPGMLLTLLLLPFVLDSLSLIGRTPQGQATALYGVDGHQHFGPAQSVADFVRATTMPHETIFIWASEPEIYLLAERQPASRFIYDYPLQLLPEAREELTRDLASRPPTLMITYHGAQPDGLKAITTQYNLRFTTTIGGYDLWTRSVPEQP